VWLGDGWVVLGSPPTGSPPNPITGDLAVTVAITLTGVYPKAWATDAAPAARGFLWFGDRSSGYSWYADADSVVTITATGPDSTVLTASGALAGAGGELNLGIAPWLLSCTLACNRFPSGDTTYARVSDLKWGTHSLQAIADLYNPGSGDEPNPVNNPDWTRAGSAGTDFRVGPDGSMGMWCEAASASPSSCLWILGPPRRVTFKPATGFFDDNVAAEPPIEVSGTPVAWAGSPPAASPDPFTGTETFEETGGDTSRFLFEWSRFSGPTMALSVTDAWRTDNGEDVDRGDPDDPDNPTTDQDDKKCALYLHPIDVTNLNGIPWDEWGTFLTITPEGNLGVVKPAGVSRPANWVGSGGLTPDETTNDLWHVAAASSAPKATLTIAERFTSRMTRMFDHADDDPWPYHWEWGFQYNRANPPTAIEELLDPEAYRFPENIWHWKNRGAGRLDITAPRAGTVVLTVNYKIPVFDFPFYAGGEWNWGPDSPSSLSWVTGTVSWNVAVEVGANTVTFDLALPNTGDYDPQLHVVTSIEVLLPAATEAEDWTLSEITLLPRDPNALSRNEGENYHHVWSMFDPYNWAADFTGFRGLLSGRRILAIPSGQDGMVGVETALMIRQKRRHDPDSEATGVLDYAKAASTTAAEIGYQEGLLCEYADPTPEVGAHNRDADLNQFVASFRAFDLRHTHEFQGDGAVNITGCPKVVSIAVPYGLCGLDGDDADEGVVVYYDKYPRGREQGLGFSGRSGRARRTGTVYLWKRPLAGGAWELTTFSAVPDRFGRWNLGPDKEKGWEYGVTDSSTTSPDSGSEFRNREYVWFTITLAGAKSLDHLRDLEGRIQVYYENTDGQLVRRWYTPTEDAYAETILWPAQTTDSHPNIMRTAGSSALTLLFIRDADAVLVVESLDNGRTWGDPLSIATGYTIAEAEIDGPRNLICALLYDGTDWKRAVLEWVPATAQWQVHGSVAQLVAGAEQRGSLRRESDGSFSFVYVDADDAVQLIRGMLDQGNTLAWS